MREVGGRIPDMQNLPGAVTTNISLILELLCALGKTEMTNDGKYTPSNLKGQSMGCSSTFLLLSRFSSLTARPFVLLNNDKQSLIGGLERSNCKFKRSVIRDIIETMLPDHQGVH